ncbi:hint-domain-containing protein [Xylaria sp. FL1042]|nr:hint-domain-containing protein [Xylaria sp. FL1042]
MGVKLLDRRLSMESDRGSGDSANTLVFDRDDAVMTIHPLDSQDGVLVRVEPPVKPSGPTRAHVPCDIVLVIDVSSSMGEAAPAMVNDKQGNATKEHFGLTVLDLIKHAARTIVSSLNDGDRLGIVTFSSDSYVVQELAPITKYRKWKLNKSIDSMQPDGWTNLWAGITKGFSLFRLTGSSGRVPALMVLTDGQPNFMCPPEGYVRKLRSMGTLPAKINTFGFGFDIKSGLLKSIAETCNGNYVYIPDAGMIGTVFVHAVAHLISTYAIQCRLEISVPEGVLLKSTTGRSIPEQEDGDRRPSTNTLTIQLGNLQYGQSRDIYLENVNELGRRAQYQFAGKNSMMHATLTYSRMNSPEYVTFADQDMLEPSPLPRSVIAYHQSRSAICDLLSAFVSVKNFEYVYEDDQDMKNYGLCLQRTINNIPARYYDDKYNRSLIEDLNGEITKALSKKEYFKRWGCHYFLSLWDAHEKQLCNAFKDPGPLMYNVNPLFIECRDVLNKNFDTLPPPKPSDRARAAVAPRKLKMSNFNSPSNACFDGLSRVRLSGGGEQLVCNLEAGDSVQTPLGPRRIRAVLETKPSNDVMVCRFGDTFITPWHPIKMDQSDHEHRDGTGWVFPMDVVNLTESYSGAVYSVLLEPDERVDAHAIRIGDIWVVTLGHGIISGEDVRAHRFLGDYDAVHKELMSMPSINNSLYLAAGAKRDKHAGMVCGFEPGTDRLSLYTS